MSTRCEQIWCFSLSSIPIADAKGGIELSKHLMITSDLRREITPSEKSAIKLSPRIARVGRDFCSSPVVLIATRRSLILQRSADRVPGDCLEERVEQRRQADVHIQNRPLYFLLSLHPHIYRSPRKHIFFPPRVNYN